MISSKKVSGILILLTLAFAVLSLSVLSGSATQKIAPAWQVHQPLVHSNLAVFPVTGTRSHPTAAYITLDEGLRAGTVEVTELGAVIHRPRPGLQQQQRQHTGGAQVNTLTLINHSKQPLLLLAGEIVTGGKQDRVVSSDRIIPPHSNLPLNVFCVEPGRWSGSSVKFDGKSFMAAPKVRQKAAVSKNQQEVWAATGIVREGMVDTMARDAAAESSAGGIGAPAAARRVAEARAALSASTSYQVMENQGAMKSLIDETSNRLQRDYEKALRGALRGQKVTGVVIAINGEVVWADVFADPELFEKYWPKLLRSYAVEAVSVRPIEHAKATRRAAERFLFTLDGKQIIEVEPGEYRLTHVDHPRYDVFKLYSLWEKTEPLLHFSKLRKDTVQVGHREPRPMQRRRR